MIHDVVMESTLTPVAIPAELLALLEATALANGCDSEELILAAIEAFLESDVEE
jgi:hypothetical protein